MNIMYISKGSFLSVKPFVVLVKLISLVAVAYDRIKDAH